MLGEGYYPQGKALETARQVLEIENPMALNVAVGCPNGCLYCHGPRSCYKKDWTYPRLPKENPLDLVKKQRLNPEGIFLCFVTDPFVNMNRKNTISLLTYFRERNVPTATLSKVDVPDVKGNRNGMTIVSLDRKFNRTWELRAPLSIERVRKLKAKHYEGEYTWVSCEPYPSPAIWEQDLIELLDAINFVDFIIFGKWNYDRRASTAEAKAFYREKAIEFKAYCEANRIRYWIKGGDK
jgi:DNA repair photolyase